MPTHHLLNWTPLVDLSLSCLPRCGMFPSVYALRDRKTRKLLQIGSAEHFRNRIFGQYLGGNHGNRTGDRLHDCHTIHSVEIAWIMTNSLAEAREKESELRKAYKKTNGSCPEWDLRTHHSSREKTSTDLGPEAVDRLTISPQLRTPVFS